jgi:hypothetical protein
MKDSGTEATLVNHILETSIVPSIPCNDKQCLCWTAYDYSENELVEKVYFYGQAISTKLTSFFAAGIQGHFQ